VITGTDREEALHTHNHRGWNMPNNLDPNCKRMMEHNKVAKANYKTLKMLRQMAGIGRQDKKVIHDPIGRVSLESQHTKYEGSYHESKKLRVRKSGRGTTKVPN